MSSFIYILSIILKILGIIVPLLIAVAFYTLAERKMMSAIQRRRGPNVKESIQSSKVCALTCAKM